MALTFHVSSQTFVYRTIKHRMNSFDKFAKKSMPCTMKIVVMRKYSYHGRSTRKCSHFIFSHQTYSLACSSTGDRRLFPLLQFRHESLQRNKRCLLAYFHQRLQRIRTMRWQFGATLPDEIKANLCEPELQWFNAYSKSLAVYMRSIGNGIGLNLTEDLKPPKSLYVEVRCVQDYGKYELDDGEVILLKKNSQHYLPRVECEPLIRQGILQHIF